MSVNADSGNPQLVCWNTPYVNLDRLPNILPSGDLGWIDTHLAYSLSHRERTLQHSVPAEKWDLPMKFKMSIGEIFLKYIKTNERVHVIRDPSFPNAHAVIILSSLRVDLSSATVAGDAALIPLNPTTAPPLYQCLDDRNTMMTTIHGQEIHLWNYALPAFAERCRQWQHLPACEYIQHKSIPLSIAYGSNPLCSCGKGKNLGSIFEDSQWKVLAPHATRISFTPIFPVTYLEDPTEQDLANLARLTGGA